MKKKLLLAFAPVLLAVGINNRAICVKAEDSESIETSEVVETEEIVEISEENFDFGNWVSEKLDFKTILTLLSDTAFIAAILKLVSSLIKEKKLTLEAKNEANKIMETLKSYLGDEIFKIIKEKCDEMLNGIQGITEKTENTLKKFAEVLALSQQNTPESKLAILELLANMNLVDEKIVEEAKESINEEVKQEEEKKEKVNDELDKIIDDTKGLI